jgi:tRNA(Ile)-lysidine synthase
VKPTLDQTVAAFFRRHAFTGGGVVALSGGPDSVCLALVLRDLYRQGTVPDLTLAHLNHQLRGADSDADEAFVRDLACAWELPCHTDRLDVATAAAQSGANLEAAARQLRYRWLAQVARDERAAWVATGHSADDQAETVLFRMLRGSGLQGLSGMAERRVLAPGIDLVRPLLSVRRAAIRGFLEARGQSFRQDRSNEDRRFTRSRLRHELLPLLAEQYNSAITAVLCRLARQARAAQQTLTACAGRLLADAELPHAGDMIVLDAAKLQSGSGHARRELFRLIWRREDWPMGAMTFAAWERLAQLAERTTAALDLPGDVRARRLGRVVQLWRVVRPGSGP